MTFYLRLVLFAGAALVSLVWAPRGLPEQTQSLGIKAMFFLMVGVFVWVAILNWFRPEALLYNADTHFKKWQMEFGTELGGAAAEELEQTTANPPNGES